MIRRRLAAYRAAGITTLRVDPAGQTLDERLTTLGRLMELVRDLGRPASRAHVAAGERPALSGLDVRRRRAPW